MTMKYDTIANYAASFKSEIDNDSIVYILKNGYAFAMARELVQKQIPSIANEDGFFNYFEDIVKKHASKSELKNVLYKNNTGVWVKLFLILRDYKNITQLFEQANNKDIYANYVASKTLIPELYFTDKDNKLWKINAKDGARTFHKKTFDYIDTLDKKTVEFTQCNMDHPEYGFSLRHLMSDLKITLKRHTTDNLLVTINGRFVNPEKKANENNTLYIRNARYYYRASSNNFIGENTEFKEATINGFKNATLGLEKDSKYLTNWLIDTNINILKWNDVNISPWMEVASITYTNEVYDYQNVRLIKYLTFGKELNPKSTIIICDGRILDESEYTIKGKNVYLKYEHAKFGILYRHFIEKGKGKRSIRNALNIINNQYYHAVEFTDASVGQPLEIRKTTPVDIDLLGNGSLLFNDPIGTNDLIITDGKIEPYTIASNGLIQYENFNTNDLFGSSIKYTNQELINVYQQESVKLNLSKYKTSIKYKEKTTIELYTTGDDYNVKVENEDIVSVEKKGKSFIVTGLNEGQSKITITSFKQFESDRLLSVERELIVEVLPPILTEIKVYWGRDSRTPIENNTIVIPRDKAEDTIELIIKSDASDFTLNYDENDEDNKLFIVDKINNHIYIDTFLPYIEMQGKSFRFSITAQAVRSWENVEETTQEYVLTIQNSNEIVSYITDLKSYKEAFASNIVKFKNNVNVNKTTLQIPHLIKEVHEDTFKVLTDADSLDYELVYDNPNHAECTEYLKVYSDKVLLPLEVTDGEESRIYEKIKVATFKINYSGFSFTPFISAKLRITHHKKGLNDFVKDYNLLGYLRDLNGKEDKTKDICVRINGQEIANDSVCNEVINCSNKEIGVYRVKSDPSRFILNSSIKCTYLIDNPDVSAAEKLIEVGPDTKIPVEIVPFQNTIDNTETLSQMQTNLKYPVLGFAIKYKAIQTEGDTPTIDKTARFNGYVKIMFWNTDTDAAVDENVSYLLRINAEYREEDVDKNFVVSNLVSNYNDHFYVSSASLLKYNNNILNKVQNPDNNVYKDLSFIMSYELRNNGEIDNSRIFRSYMVYELAKDEFGNSLISLYLKRNVIGNTIDTINGTVTLNMGYGYEPKDKNTTPDTVFNTDTTRTEQFKFLNKNNVDALFDTLIIKDFNLTNKNNVESVVTKYSVEMNVVDSLDVTNNTNYLLNNLNKFIDISHTNNRYEFELNNDLIESYYKSYDDISDYNTLAAIHDETERTVVKNKILVRNNKTYRTKDNFIITNWETDQNKLEEYDFIDKDKITTSVQPSIPWLPTIKLFPHSKFTIDLTNFSMNRKRKYTDIDVIETTEDDIVVGDEVHLQFFSDNSDIMINSDTIKDKNNHILNESYVEYAMGTDFLVICAENPGIAKTCIKSKEAGIVSSFKKELEFDLSFDTNLDKVEFDINEKNIEIDAPFYKTVNVDTTNIDDYDYSINNNNVTVLRDENRNLVVYGLKKGISEITLVGKKVNKTDSDPIVITVNVNKINGEEDGKEIMNFIYPLDQNSNRRLYIPFYKFSHTIEDENIITAEQINEAGELKFTAKKVGSTVMNVNLLEKNINNKKIERFELVNFYEITTLD